MSIVNRIYFLFFISSLVTLFIMSAIFFFTVNNTFNTKIINNYKHIGNVIKNSVGEIDRLTNSKLLNVTDILKHNSENFESMSNNEMKRYAKKLEVTHLFIIDRKEGRYIKSTCEPPEELPNYGYYCPSFHSFFNNHSIEKGPFVHGYPEKESYKFWIFPNPNKNLLYSIGLKTNFINKVFQDIIKSYSIINSIGLYAPNGDNLILYRKNEIIGRSKNLKINMRKEGTYKNSNKDIVNFVYKLKTDNTECCYCQKHLQGTEEKNIFTL